MTVGTILAKVVLDEPKRVYSSSHEPVKGNVHLTYRPSPKTLSESNNPELFGPLKVTVSFHGRCKTKVWRSNGNTTHIYRGRAPLFNRITDVYDDSFRTRPNVVTKFPFEVYFPDGAQALTTDYFDEDVSFTYKAGDPLPPSFEGSYHGFANRYESFIEYRIGVRVSMPQLEMIIRTPEKEDEALVYYNLPQSETMISKRFAPWIGSCSVKNELLLPESDRPSGLRQKAKAAFTSDFYPTYAFDWRVEMPGHLYMREPIVFRVRITPREGNTAIVAPEVKISHFFVVITSLTEVRAEKQFFTSPGAHSDSTEVRVKAIHDESEPFSKANEWTKMLQTRDLRDLCSSFRSYNIYRRYHMTIRWGLTFADKYKEYEKEIPVEIHPPPKMTTRSESGPSSAGGGSSSLQHGDSEPAVPEYDRPPEYEEAVDEMPHSSVQEKKE